MNMTKEKKLKRNGARLRHREETKRGEGRIVHHEQKASSYKATAFGY
jgi:hypothetical protein